MNPQLGVLAAGYGALLVYASLYPFTGWQQGVDRLGFLTSSWPAVAPRFDNYVNVLAYIPLGLLIALSLRNQSNFARRVILATLAGFALSFSMEFLQQYLPRRIASPADLATNSCGALFGALASSLFDPERVPGRVIAQWRNRWIKPGPQFTLALTVLAAWALSQWLPGVPSFNLAALREGIAPAWHTAQDLLRFDVLQWGRYALYLSGLALLVKTLANPGRPAVGVFFCLVAAVFVYKVAVMGRQLSLEAVTGAFSAALLAGLWLALRVKTIAKVGALFIAGGLVCAHFLPGADSAQHLSNWTPLRGPIDHPTLGLGSVFEILWPAAALGYFGRMAAPAEWRRAVAWGGGAALAILASGIAWHDQHVPITTGLLMGATWALFGTMFSAPVSGSTLPNIFRKPPSSALVHAGVATPAIVIVALACPEAWADESARAPLRVGPQHVLKTPSAAAKVARDGDLVEIEPGLYRGDAAVWTQNRLTLRGNGGVAHLRADGAHAEGKAIWVIKGADTVIENLEFSGARVSDRNGAGIRLEGPGLTVRRSYFHHNEMGILVGVNPASHILVEHCEFAYNMRPDGHNHNVYIGAVGSFTLRSSYVHHAAIGHNVKSRALKNYIVQNRIIDGREGRSSYTLEFPNGGLSIVVGNVLQQGPATENPTIVSFGAEGLTRPDNELYFAYNTVVNEGRRSARFIFVKAGTATARIVNNVFAGPGELLVGRGELANNARAALSDFVAPQRFDYRLKSTSLAAGLGATALTFAE